MNGKGSKLRPTNIKNYIQNFDEIDWGRKENKMKISEIFKSIQGEGISSGTPCVFVRFFGCNLYCGMKGLFEEGKATWKCDTEKVWTQYTEYTNEQLIQKLKDMDVLKDIINGKLRVVVSGGEVSIKSNREAFKDFLFRKLYPIAEAEGAINHMFFELETNGTIYCEDNFYEWFDQINCSPKLSNSGLPEKIRVNGEAISQINKHINSWFKFVINNEKDAEEVMSTYVKPFNIDLNKVIFMPDSDSVTTIAEKTRNIWNLALDYKVKMCTRLHILCFDKKIGI